MGPLLKANVSCSGNGLSHPTCLNSLRDLRQPLTATCHSAIQASSPMPRGSCLAKRRTNTFLTGSFVMPSLKCHPPSRRETTSERSRQALNPRCAEIGLFSWASDNKGTGKNKRPAIVYVPGSDGTGTAISPQVSQLQAQGYDVWSLVLPTSDRSSWQQLANRLKQLLRRVRTARDGITDLEAAGPKSAHVTLVAESFGAWIALLCAAQAPHLVDRVVLLNPATRFASSQPLLAAISNAQVLQVAPAMLYSTILDVMVAPIMSPIDPATLPSHETRMLKGQATAVANPPAAGSGRKHGASKPRPAWPVGGWEAVRAGSGDTSAARTLIQSLPKDCAAHRLRLMVEGMGPPAQEEAVLASVTQPVLLLASARDQVLDSVGETRRLESKLQGARARTSRSAARLAIKAKNAAPAGVVRVILPDCSHMPLLEAPFSLAATMHKHGFAAPAPAPATAPVTPITPSIPPLQAPAVIQAGGPQVAVALDTSETAVGAAASSVRASTDALTPTGMTVVAREAYYEAQTPRGDATVLSAAVESSLTVILPAGATTDMARAGGGADVAPELRAKKEVPRARSPKAGPSDEDDGDEDGVTDSRGDFHPSNLDELGRMLEPWRLLTSPKIYGAESLPRSASQGGRPVLFVGNHGLYGFYDSPLIFHELHLQGFTCRAMAHPNIINGPLGPLFKRYGSVKATPKAMFNALKNGENVLLFPGGARDVHKKKGQKNQIVWAEERNFIRLAARFGAVIVPFATLGADDSYEIALDADDMLASPLLGPLLGQIIRSSGIPEEELLLPVPGVPLGNVVLPSLVPIPRVQRVYLYFGQPVDTSLVPQVLRNKEACHQVFERLRGEVQSGIEYLKEMRAQDPEADVATRLRNRASQALANLTSWLRK